MGEITSFIWTDNAAISGVGLVFCRQGNFGPTPPLTGKGGKWYDTPEMTRRGYRREGDFATLCAAVYNGFEPLPKSETRDVCSFRHR